MSLRILSRALVQPLRGFALHHVCPRPHIQRAVARGIHTTPFLRYSSFTNLLADEQPPPVQVSSVKDEGILLADGLLLPSSCIFHDGNVFLWDVPQNLWEGWGPERFEFFEATVPRPEILVLGTGKTLVQPPPFLRSYFTKLGIQLDVMSTRNACSTYNLLSEEGRRVAAALMPLVPHAWHRAQVAQRPHNTQRS